MEIPDLRQIMSDDLGDRRRLRSPERGVPGSHRLATVAASGMPCQVLWTQIDHQGLELLAGRRAATHAAIRFGYQLALLGEL